jgi:MoxR-like ATPase
MHESQSPATRGKASNMALPVWRTPIAVTLHLSALEYAALQPGMRSQDMGQKWQAFFEEPWLYLHRVSGVCVYAIRFAPVDEGFTAVQAFVNDDAQQNPGSVDICFTTAQGHAHYIAVLVHQVIHKGDGVPIPKSLLDAMYAARGSSLEALKAGGRMVGFGTVPDEDTIDRRLLLGPIVGDVVGSSYEAVGQKTTDFELLTQWSKFTDDTVLTCSVAQAVMYGEPFAPAMRRWGRRHLMAGYGQGFELWIHDESMGSYGSSGNGSAMRVAAIGLSAASREEALDLAARSAECTHNHPQGILGAQAIALAVWLAHHGKDKFTLREEVAAFTGYNLNRTLAEIRPSYGWSASCADSVPESILCFLEAEDFEQAIRNAVSLGGDADTMAAMAGAIAAAFWGGVPAELVRRVVPLLSLDVQDAVNSFAYQFPWKPQEKQVTASADTIPTRTTAAVTNAPMRAIASNLETVMQGQAANIRKVVSAWVAGLHILLDDNPGTGKTTLAKALALSVEASFSRVQFTPDLLPSDIVGVSIYDASAQTFRFHDGPVFAHVLLADEINRASPRTQSALLEAMAEAQVTVDGERKKLPQPYLVIATQNPVDQAGTYPLPEAQMDRFGIRLGLGYVSAEDEVGLLEFSLAHHPLQNLRSCAKVEDLLAAREAIATVHVSPELRQYIVALVQATRSHPSVQVGASPRASIALFQLVRALAFFDGEDFVTPDAIQDIAADVLAHRITLAPQARYAGSTGVEIVRSILQSTPVPV